MFGDIEIEKNNFYRHNSPIFLKDVNIEKVLESKNNSSGEKIMNIVWVTLITVRHYI